MSAIRLEVATHIVHGSATALQNLTKCVRQAGVRPDELVVASLASGEAVLRRRSASWAWPWPTSAPAPPTSPCTPTARPSTPPSCPSAASTSPTTSPSACAPTSSAAEQLKMRFGSADARAADTAAEAAVEIIDDGVARPARSSDVTEIIEARMRELFEKIGEQISGHASIHRLPAGLVLTGGGSQLAGVAELGRDVLQHPGPRGLPSGRRRPHRPSPDALLRHRHRPAAVGGARRQGAGHAALRAATGGCRLEPHARPHATPLPLIVEPSPAGSPRPGLLTKGARNRAPRQRTAHRPRGPALSAWGGTEDILAATTTRRSRGSLDRARVLTGQQGPGSAIWRISTCRCVRTQRTSPSSASSGSAAAAATPSTA